MAWTPIVRLAARPERRQHRLDASLVTVAVPLNRAPPQDWVAAFLYPPGRSRVLHELAVAGSRITFTVEKADDVSTTIADVDERIRAANVIMQRSTTR